MESYEIVPMNLLKCLERIQDPRKDIILKIYHYYEDLFHSNPGSSHNHQAWPGGLADHLADMFRLCEIEYTVLTHFLYLRGESMPFTIGSAQIAIFLHDAEKVVVYGSKDDPRCSMFFNSINNNPTLKTVKENIKWDVIEYWRHIFRLNITDQEFNAIRFTHGEGSLYNNERRIMNELAAFVGNIDRTSARILHSSGKDLG